MTREELDKILELHKKWLNSENDGVRADLSGVDLRFVDLSGANLTGTILTGAGLSGANLSGANLTGAILTGACLSDANLQGANLSHAILTSTNMCNANLRWVKLTGANLSYTNLAGANMAGAILCGANLTGVKYSARTSFLVLQCPEEGAFIAYKKVECVIIKLEVPEDAKRSSATTRKCRCSKARVLAFYDLDGKELAIEEVVNHNYVTTIYRKGEMAFPDSWDDDRWNECSNGIHFFVTFDEAKNY